MRLQNATWAAQPGIQWRRRADRVRRTRPHAMAAFRCDLWRCGLYAGACQSGVCVCVCGGEEACVCTHVVFAASVLLLPRVLTVLLHLS